MEEPDLGRKKGMNARPLLPVIPYGAVTHTPRKRGRAPGLLGQEMDARPPRVVIPYGAASHTPHEKGAVAAP